jgi:hypothetical protein
MRCTSAPAILDLRTVPLFRFLAVHLIAVLFIFYLAVAGPVSERNDLWGALTPASFFWFAKAIFMMSVVSATVYLGARAIGCIWRLGREIEVDLLALDSLAPFSRIGLRLAGSLMSASAFLACVVVSTGGTVSDFRFPLGFYVLSWVLALAALVLPSWGLRHSVREAKRHELSRVTRAIHGEAGALVDSPLDDRAENLSVIDLVLYRSHIEGISEWPFGNGVLSRFGIYALLPVASWVCGALVERGIDALVG